MTIFNLGSINADFTYQVPHLLQAGETLAASSLTRGLGGKGANMSVAIARGAGRVQHIGAVGEKGAWATLRLLEYGVDTRHIATVPEATGHAIISVDPAGENNILIFPGANACISPEMLGRALSAAHTGDWLIMQNETNCLEEAANMARQLGLRVAYAAAPFVAEDAAKIAPLCELMFLNQIEAQQLSETLGTQIEKLGIADIIVTLGADGCDWYHNGTPTRIAGYPAKVIDTTGAGDTFTGYVMAGLDRGLPMAQAIDLAQQAAALMVGRLGTADVIPDLKEVTEARLSRN